MPQTRKAFERAEFEGFVQQKRARLATWRAGGIEEREKRVERLACVGGDRVGAMPSEWRYRRDGGQETLRCRGASLDVDVLSRAAPDPVSEAQEQERPTGSTTPQDDWNPRGRSIERALHAPIEPSWCTRHSTTPSFTKATDLVADSVLAARALATRPHMFRHCGRNVKRTRYVDVCFPTS